MIRKAWILLLVCQTVFGETIEEKRAAMNPQGASSSQTPYLKEMNEELDRLRMEIQDAHRMAQADFEAGVDVKDWLGEIKALRADMSAIEERWRSQCLDEAEASEEGYGLWDQEETTIAQLVMEYGSLDYLYIIPPDLMSLKIQLHSSMPIPRRLWSELIEVILSQNGIGIKQLTPLVRQLYSYKNDLMAVQKIVSCPQRLKRLPPGERVLYVFSPPSEDIKSVFYFFERFRDAKRTYVHQVGGKIAIVSTKDEIVKLLDLYDAVWADGQKRTIRVLALSKISPKEMEKMLKAFFGPSADNGRMTVSKGGAHLSMLPLPNEGSIALIGIKETIERAEALVRELEAQVEDPMEMTVYWYPCRHSDPNDLSDVLEKVYQSLAYSNLESGGARTQCKEVSEISVNVSPQQFGVPTAPAVINTPPVDPGEWSTAEQSSQSKHFIPYVKTGSIMMVVRRDLLPKIKELLKNLDVPKQMVQIEIIILERKITSQNNFGLNILKLGSAASQKHATGLSFDASSPKMPGILDFFISRAKSSHFPAYDLTYNFLMSQDDIRINATPTITTVNQTPAKLSIVEEISVNNGVAPVETNGVTVFEKSFSRNQYGLTLVITPTVHQPSIEDIDGKYFVTLDAKIAFDNPQESTRADQPNVDRSTVENQVRVADGEMMIIGGLRRKTAEDAVDKMPFLGEIPGIGKLFGTSKMCDRLRELMVFIKPTVIIDPQEDVRRVRCEELKKRAGDIPEFLECLKEAQDKEKARAIRSSFDIMFGS
ncbi:MAG: type II secretion system protein GspD [Chlamydiales bacterium]|nr:type II secretion system protein GspD [Chlamydiales bacterium]